MCCDVTTDYVVDVDDDAIGYSVYPPLLLFLHRQVQIVHRLPVRSDPISILRGNMMSQQNIRTAVF